MTDEQRSEFWSALLQYDENSQPGEFKRLMTESWIEAIERDRRHHSETGLALATLDPPDDGLTDHLARAIGAAPRHLIGHTGHQVQPRPSRRQRRNRRRLPIHRPMFRLRSPIPMTGRRRRLPVTANWMTTTTPAASRSIGSPGSAPLRGAVSGRSGRCTTFAGCSEMIEVHVTNYDMTLHLPDGLSEDQLMAAIAGHFPKGRPPVIEHGLARAFVIEPYTRDDGTISTRWTCTVNPGDPAVPPPPMPYANGIKYGLADDLDAAAVRRSAQPPPGGADPTFRDYRKPWVY
jgi:hypothetical protein